MRGRRSLESLGGVLHGAPGVRVARRRQGLARIEHRLEQQRRVLDQRELLRLLLRHEARQRKGVIDLG